MPSNRAILADIAEFGLDPHVAHTSVSSSGRLRPHHSSTNKQQIEETKIEQQPEAKKDASVEKTVETDTTDRDASVEPKNALVELPASPVVKKNKSKKQE